MLLPPPVGGEGERGGTPDVPGHRELGRDHGSMRRRTAWQLLFPGAVENAVPVDGARQRAIPHDSFWEGAGDERPCMRPGPAREKGLPRPRTRLAPPARAQAHRRLAVVPAGEAGVEHSDPNRAGPGGAAQLQDPAPGCEAGGAWGLPGLWRVFLGRMPSSFQGIGVHRRAD